MSGGDGVRMMRGPRRVVVGSSFILNPSFDSTRSLVRYSREMCRTMASTAFYQSLLGIKSATSMGTPPNEIRLVYSAGEGVNEDERTLSILLDASGRMIGASVSLVSFAVGRS